MEQSIKDKDKEVERKKREEHEKKGKEKEEGEGRHAQSGGLTTVVGRPCPVPACLTLWQWWSADPVLGSADPIFFF